MKSMDLFKAFGDIDDNLVYDTINNSMQPQNASGAAPVKQPKPNKPQRGGAKTKAIAIGAVAVVLAAAIICMILYFTGVFGGKQVPIYTGMEISAVDTTSSTNSTSAVSYHYSGDYYGRSDDIDKDKPFGDGSATIEQQMQSTLQVAGASESIYYADAGDDIYITIKFSNPDSYEILSFVINGDKYTSYMFETGSDLENIIIKVNVGTVGGIVEYTISEIKYVDGTEIKNVTMEGDPVVKCGVRTSDITYATISDEVTTLTSISFTAKIVDLYSLVEYSDGYVKAVLYDGESIVQMIDLEIGTNEVVFDNLTPDTLYQYAVVGYFDNLSGGGTALNYLYTNAVYTPAVVLFDSISISQDSITFGYSWYTGYSGAISSLTLAGGGTTQTLSASAVSAANLLSDTTYTLTAYYTGTNGETESITLEFTTEAKATPAVEISTLESTQESISYSLSITDTDSVGTKTEVTLSLNGETVQTLTTSSGTFTGLLSDNTYTLTAVYTYNLNDGTDSHTMEDGDSITTKAKATPGVAIEITDATTSSLTYSVNYTDTDGVGAITAIELYNGSTLVKSESNLNQVEYTYNGLSSYTEYTLKVSYGYDLNDGVGTQTAEQTLAEYTYPSLTLNSVSCDNTSAVTEGGTIYLTANVNNPNGVSYTSAVVNGVTYTDVSGSNGSTLYVDVVNNGQFEGGNTTLTITKITCTIGGKTYTIDISENNEVTAFIYGTFTVVDYTVVRYNATTEQYEQTYYGFPDEQLYYKISLDNETGYKVDSVTIENTTYTSSSITMSDDMQAAYIPLDDSVITNGGNALYNSTYLYGVSYSYGVDVSKSTPVNISAYYVRLESSDVIEISSVDDLTTKINSDKRCYYVLTDNIDLSDTEWVNKGIVLRGVFDGNNYTISGIGAKTTYENTDLSLGLFSSIDAAIINLTLEVDYRITLNDSSTTSRSVYISSLGATNNLIADNVNVDLKVVFIANAKIGSLQVCGLGGAIFTKDITVNMDVSITTKDEIESIAIGGLSASGSGDVENADITLKADVTIAGDPGINYAVDSISIGGIIGSYSDGSNTVSSVTVDMDVTITCTSAFSISVGGLIGSVWYATSNLDNISTDVTLNISSGLNYAYGKYASGDVGVYIDEATCSGTITVNEVS